MRIDSLTFFRFAAAVIVLFFHYGKETDMVAMFSPFIVAGPAMVTFFFTLSGFVMLISHYHKTEQTLRSYYVARAARIAPIYIVALFFTAYLVMGYGINDIYSLILSSVFMQSWVSPYPTAMNTPGWSLSVEVFFYLNFPIILYVLRRYKPKLAYVAVFTLLLYIVTQAILSYLSRPGYFQPYPSLPHDLVTYFPLSHLCSFMMGVTGGLFCLRYPQYFNRSSWTTYPILLAAFYLTYIVLQNPDATRNIIEAPLALGSSFYTWLALILILAVAQGNNLITRLFASRPLEFLGDVSLSFYILQKPVHIVYVDYISPSLELGINGDFYAFATLLLCLSCVTHLTIEKIGSNMIFGINKLIPKKATTPVDSSSAKTSQS